MSTSNVNVNRNRPVALYHTGARHIVEDLENGKVDLPVVVRPVEHLEGKQTYTSKDAVWSVEFMQPDCNIYLMWNTTNEETMEIDPKDHPDLVAFTKECIGKLTVTPKDGDQV